MGTTGSSIRNQICAAVLARIQSINGQGNYITDLSSTDCVRFWRKADWTFSENPEVSIMDNDEETTQGPFSKGATGTWMRELKFEIAIAIGEKVVRDDNGNVIYTDTGGPQLSDGGNSNIVANFIRDAFADFDFALGAETNGDFGRFWNFGGQRLALNTAPGKSTMIVWHEEFFMGVGSYEFTIQYRIPAFSPNTVAL